MKFQIFTHFVKKNGYIPPTSDSNDTDMDIRMDQAHSKVELFFVRTHFQADRVNFLISSSNFIGTDV